MYCHKGRGMPPTLPAVAIGVQRRRRPFPKLTRHRLDHGSRCLGRFIEECTEKTRRPKLDCESDPVVRAAHLPDQFAVSGVEVKVASALLLVGIAGVAAVARALLIGQETARHGVRNSGLLRQSGRGPRIKHLHAERMPFGITHLCDKFRMPAEGWA